MQKPFSFKEISQITSKTPLKTPSFIQAIDGIQLAYYSFVPTTIPKAILLFYHGAGIWSNKMYQYMANQMCNDYAIATYLVDIRGHGNSGGPRGDAPNAKQVWADIDSMIDFIKANHPNTPLFLGGHSAGGGLILNYGSRKQNKAVKGYIFLAPFLGPHGDTNRKDGKEGSIFVKSVKLWALILNGISGGRIFNNTPAIYFNYPEWLRQQDPNVLGYYTCAMSQAVTPRDAKKLFAQLGKPSAIYIGENDEQFDPKAVISHTHYLTSDKDISTAQIVSNASHLSIVCEAPQYINEAIHKVLGGAN